MNRSWNPRSSLDWLLQEDAPQIQFEARRLLLGEATDSASMRRLTARFGEYPPVAQMLERLDEALAVGPYTYYTGAYWTLIFLAEMGPPTDDPRLSRLVGKVLAHQLPSGSFSAVDLPKGELVCLTANVLRSLVRLGYGASEAVQRGYRRLLERVQGAAGIPCFVADQTSLRATCRMAIPQTLRALAAAPVEVDARALRQARSLLLGRLHEMRIYRYERPDANRFYSRLPAEITPPEFMQEKARYRAEHPSHPQTWLPKPQWLRLGFPSSYEPDILEALFGLVELGAPHHPSLDDALDQLEAKAAADGRWLLERSLDGELLADIESVGKPSKWLTLRALAVLEHFGRLEL